ncbi:MAG: type VI secretion system baseplate subunit TssG [Bdellovibrionota bacterium]
MTKAEKQKIEQEIYTKIIDSFSPSLGILQIMQILDTAGIALNKKNAGDDTPYGRIGFGGSNYFEKFFFKTEPQFNPHPPTVDKIVYQPNSPLRRADKDVVEVFVNEVSLYNIFTPLPSNYIELIAKRIKEKDTALSSFLDIFFNIFLSLLFKGWRRQNILYVFEDSLRSGMNPKTPREVVEDYITAFTGLEKTSFDANYEFDNFFTGTNRSGANFVSMLSHYLKNIPVRIENGGGETVKPEFPKLINPNTGEKQWANERGIPFHDEVILADNKQCFILGPMTYEQYLDFHPKKPLLAEVCRLIEDYFQQPHITYTIKMLVTNPPPLKMDGSLTPGFDMWFTDKDTKLVTKEFYPVPREWLVKYEKEQEKLNPLPQKLKGSRYILPEDFAYYIHKLDAPELEKLYQYVIREIGNISEFTTDWVRKNPIAAENSGFNEFGKTTDYELSRLIEFSAFIIAELRQKIDEPPMDYFANTLLEQSNPNLFLPVPALSIVEVNLHSRIKQEEILQRQTQIYLTTNEKKEIPFSTCYTTKLIPAKINRVELFHTYKAKHLNQSKIPLVRNTLEINLE